MDDNRNFSQTSGDGSRIVQKVRYLPGGSAVALNIYIGGALSKFANSEHEFLQFLHLYQQVFGAAPWNEGALCPKCGFSVPLSEFQSLGVGAVCPHCHVGILEPFYPLDKMRKRMTMAFSGQRGDTPFLLLPKIGEEIAGFSWGMVAPFSAIREHNLDTYFLDAEKPKGRQSFDAVFQAYQKRCWSLEKVASIDALAVAPAQRESGLYALLEQELVRSLLKIGCNSVLISTIHMSKMYHILIGRFPGLEVLHRQDENVVFLGMSAR